MRAYASKDGVSDSIKTIYKYTSGKVKNVEATPNGGAVMKNTEVTLKCATEGATILYCVVRTSNDVQSKSSQRRI